MEKELVYLFLYNPMVFTSGWITQSVHKTRKSAMSALENHKAASLHKWQEDFESETERNEHPFGKFEDWKINPMVLQE